jgi:lipopolysaccharide export system ATP-binding protein
MVNLSNLPLPQASSPSLLKDAKAPILKVEKLVKSYGSRAVVNGLSFEIKAGEVVGLLGPNGAGKTTAFYMTIGLIQPDAGKVTFLQEDVTKLSIHERAKLGMGYLAQEPSVFRSLTVEENLLCILETLSLSKEECQTRMKQLLADLHLEKVAKKLAGTLSGGERRRLEISRALATDPRLLLLDEPFANIDPLAIQDVKQLIKLLKAKGISILITDHNAREIFSIVDRSYLVREGKAILSGTVQELLHNKEARTFYLGEDFRL